jgi:hypothetical protein
MNFGTEKQVKLRKTVRCAWCGQDMMKGKTVYQFKGRWNGDWQNWKMHNECRDVYYDDDCFDEGFSLYDNERPKITRISNRFA